MAHCEVPRGSPAKSDIDDLVGSRSSIRSGICGALSGLCDSIQFATQGDAAARGTSGCLSGLTCSSPFRAIEFVCQTRSTPVRAMERLPIRRLVQDSTRRLQGKSCSATKHRRASLSSTCALFPGRRPLRARLGGAHAFALPGDSTLSSFVWVWAEPHFSLARRKAGERKMRFGPHPISRVGLRCPRSAEALALPRQARQGPDGPHSPAGERRH